jgi:hypothetical protein
MHFLHERSNEARASAGSRDKNVQSTGRKAVKARVDLLMLSLPVPRRSLPSSAGERGIRTIWID